jgi:hypothetical protein
MHQNIVTESFIAGHADLYQTVREYPDLRMVPIDRLATVRTGLRSLGYRARIRYRGPHGPRGESLKHNARAFTVYFPE